MNIFKVSFFTAISQATSLLVGLIAVKILAVEIGPEGVALQSQFLNSVIFFYVLSTGAINTGTIKYLSQYFDDKDSQLKVIRASLTITVICSIFFGICLLAGSNILANRALLDDSYSAVYLLYGLFLPITAMNFILTSILNGLGQIKYLTIANVITSVVNLLFLFFFAKSLGLYGILIYANFSSIIIFIIHLVLVKKYKWFRLQELKPYFDKDLMAKLLGFSLMSIFAAFIAPFSQLVIRNKLIADFGLAKAGEWQTVMRISDFYLAFIMGILSVYLLPKLSSLKDDGLIRAEIIKVGKLVLPTVIMLTFIIWLSRDLIINLLLTEKFKGTKELFNFQLLGDIFKIGGWMLSMILWAKAKTKLYLITDIIALIIFIVITLVCINLFDTIGATYGFCISYFIYLLMMIGLNRKYLFRTGGIITARNKDSIS